jgi:aryl-alcohol dehydrogenase-like predicted oxidoreductase
VSFDFPPVDKDRGYAIVDALKEVGEAHGGASVARVALAWLLHQDGVTSVIIGGRKIKQIEDNLQAVDLELTTEELTRLDEVSRLAPEYPGWFPPLERGMDLGSMMSDIA